MYRLSQSPGWLFSRIGRMLVVILSVALCTVPAKPADTVVVSIITPIVDAARGNVVLRIGSAAVDRLKEKTPDGNEWPRLLTVCVARPDDAETPPILGSYVMTNDAIVFTPRFPFIGDLDYVVVVDCTRLATIAGVDCDADTIEKTFRLEVRNVAPSTTVTAVYPTADVLPENLLKFYVYFSSPMAEGNAFAGVQIFNADGDAVPDAFVQTTPELWDPKMRRLTLILHPGKIKRGLEMRKRSGPALRAGERYRLVVATSLKDAFGNPLVSRFEKPFRVAEADRQSPDLQKWIVRSPPHDDTKPLVVRFDEPIDHALARRMITVERDGETVEGAIELGAEETQWTFHPRNDWSPGTYSLVIRFALEDLAGNTIHRLFDDPTASGTQQTAPIFSRVEFIVSHSVQPHER